MGAETTPIQLVDEQNSKLTTDCACVMGAEGFA